MNPDSKGSKASVIMIGNSGTGKSMLMRNICQSNKKIKDQIAPISGKDIKGKCDTLPKDWTL